MYICIYVCMYIYIYRHTCAHIVATYAGIRFTLRSSFCRQTLALNSKPQCQ